MRHAFSPIYTCTDNTPSGVPLVGAGFDWIKEGKVFNHFKYPPLSNDDFEPFKENLKPIIETKLEECLNRQNELLVEHKRLIGKIIQTKSKEKWFLQEYEAAVFSEYYIIHKWIAYWLTLYGKITDQKMDIFKYAKFEQFEIDQAKEFPFEQLVGVEFRKIGNKWFTKCPFHKENTASFCIFPNNRAKCFGGCGWSGDTIKFLMDSKGLKFYEAVRELL